MGLPIVGLFVRGISNGIGVAKEINAAHKKKSPTNPSATSRPASAASSPPTTGPEGSTFSPSRNDPPPPYTDEEVYIEVPADQARELLGTGDARLADTKDGALVECAEDDGKEVGGSGSPVSEDEADWQLDEAVRDLEDDKSPLASPNLHSPSSADAKKHYGFDAQPTIASLAGLVVARCGPPPAVLTPLPHPVILPQRRPGSKGRGFIRAYAPDLQSAANIDQATFLYMLKAWTQASQASPILNIIYLSAGIVGFVPHVAFQVSSLVVQMAVGAAVELQKRQRTNSFLDEMNERLFRPRGLYALIMAYKPDAERPVGAQAVDLNAIIGKRSGATASDESLSPDWVQKLQTMHVKMGSGNTYGELEMPEAAELVFPSLNEMQDSGAAENVNRLKKTSKHMQDYYDRRAQALYSASNPNSPLALQGERSPQFASRFSDPNHPVNSGSLVALVSGGKYTSPHADRKAARRERRGVPNGARRGHHGPIGGLIALGTMAYKAASASGQKSPANDDATDGSSADQGHGGGRSFVERREVSGGLDGAGKEYRTGYGPDATADPNPTNDQKQQPRTQTQDRYAPRGRGFQQAGISGVGEQQIHHGPGGGRRRGRGMKKGVFYLMIVNMPSEAEMLVAKETFMTTQPVGQRS